MENGGFSKDRGGPSWSSFERIIEAKAYDAKRDLREVNAGFEYPGLDEDAFATAIRTYRAGLSR